MKSGFISFLIILLLSCLSSMSQVPDTIKLPPPQKTGGMPLMESLQNRRSTRSYSEKELDLQELSNLLWAAYGVNRPGEKRTAPSAHGWNEFDIYIIKSDGFYLYKPVEHEIHKLGEEDLCSYAGTQEYVKTAPVNLIYVADYECMTNATEEQRDFYSAADVGFISQNVYLYCASAGLSTVVRGGINKDKVREVLNLNPDQHIKLAQTIGYPSE